MQIKHKTIMLMWDAGEVRAALRSSINSGVVNHTGMSLKEKVIKSVSEFVSYIEGIKDEEFYWYRGGSRTNHLLTPSIVWKKLSEFESSLEHEFLIAYKAYSNEKSLSPWEIFALMQHHGIPTRLLDWSESALVALYFALSSEPKYKGFRAVWILNPYSLNKASIGEGKLYCPAIISSGHIDENDDSSLNLDSYLPPNLKPLDAGKLPDKPIAICSPQHIKRMSSQRSCFTVHGKNKKGIHAYLENKSDISMLKIDAKSSKRRNEMIDVLSCLGINEEVIFQDLDALCRRISREYMNL